ncbi:MAG: hypothetical protein SRB1_02919 [Desulfobacteraceae bacterium Eth-SRB1]|nr:MAG: hypothetical protein SRB1_02919 [Desulfobacteraceae bacterium Eth-SRB1]
MLDASDTAKKILIVDDQEEIRRLVEMALRVEDYHIFQAESGEEVFKEHFYGEK